MTVDFFKCPHKQLKQYTMVDTAEGSDKKKPNKLYRITYLFSKGTIYLNRNGAEFSHSSFL